ncbi:MAG: MerR family transcriptional regulator [Actinomycetota bacterium]
MTSGANERPYLSIGEVLGLLLEEFPDVTISKIRFLESQGLIEPERTSSGYRKFFDADIERLRVILREQRENFLPLRVIRDRLETGEIDDSGSIALPAPTDGAAPRGIRNVRVGQIELDVDGTGQLDLDDPTDGVDLGDRAAVTSRHPAAQARPLSSVPQPAFPPATQSAIQPPPQVEVYDRGELCAVAGITSAQLAELESFGLVVAKESGGSTTYTGSDAAIVRVAAGFLARGIDARHLRGWRQSAEREVGLFEQRIMPLLRQRNPHARVEATTLLEELTELGSELRAALVASLVRPHLDS